MSGTPFPFVARLLVDSPLRHRRFRNFYLGSVGTALGYTMQATICAWLMATLTPSALMVALVQTASTTPALMLGLAAGALADIIDRRRVVLVSQYLLLGATVLLGASTVAGLVGPTSLLMLTFVIGIGFTFYMPTQQAMINDLVPHAELAPAVALGAVAFNVSRALGPALAGALMAGLGAGSALLLCAILFVGMIFAMLRAPGSPPSIPGIPETLVSGIRSGVRYAWHASALRSLLLRTALFTLCASALWALLPLIARDQFGMGAGGFGLLFGCFGSGAVAAALALPRLLQRFTLNRVVNAGFVIWAAASALVAVTSWLAVAAVAIAACGCAWVSVLASVSAGTQSSVPGWVRARALALNMVAFQASVAIGSAFWGWLASTLGLFVALSGAAGAIVLALLVVRRSRVALGQESDLRTGIQLPELVLAGEPLPDDGPVLIQVEYRIPPERRAGFLQAIRRVEAARRRNGASAWRIFRDLEDDGRFVERFVITSWAEYVRLRARLTTGDQELQDDVRELQQEGVPVRTSRLIGIGHDDGPPAS